MIWLPIDDAETEAPSPDAANAWLRQVPPRIAAAAGGVATLFLPYRGGALETRDFDLLASLAPKEKARAAIAGEDFHKLLRDLSRFWRAARRWLEAERPTALLLWNCGNADHNVWTRLAGEHGIPVMHAEGGWLPATRIFDPVGSYVTGSSLLDSLGFLPGDEAIGIDLVARWRTLRQSKIASGSPLSDEAKAFAARGPALLVAMQLETDGAAVYHATEFDSQRELLRKCLTWPGPVLVKPHPAAARIEWQPEFEALRDACRLEVEAKGGLMVPPSTDLFDLFDAVTAVAAMNSNVLLEAALAGRVAYSFGDGPFTGQGFVLRMAAGDEWHAPRPQLASEALNVATFAAKLVRYLTPLAAWEPGWDCGAWWGGPAWANAGENLEARWATLLGVPA